MNNSTAGERMTAAVSTVVAIVLLGAAVTADPAPGLLPDQIQLIESDLRFQLELAFRSDGPERQRRVEQVDAALAAWRASPRGAREEQVLMAWLQAALRESMPGRGGKFPEAPDFSPPPVLQPPSETPIANESATTEPQQSAAPVPAHLDANASRARMSPPTPAAPTPTPSRRTSPVAQRPAPLPPASTAIPPGPSRAPRTVQQPIIIAVTPPAPIVDGAPELPLSVRPAGPGDAAPAAEHSISMRPSSPSLGSRGLQPPLPPAPIASEVPYASTAAEATSATIEPTGESDGPAITNSEPSDIESAPAPAAIRVNLRELNARIHGYHQALGEVEAATVVTGPLSERELERLIARLESLTGQSQLVQLYFDALSDAERRQVAKPRAMHGVIDLVDRHVRAAEESNDIFAEFDAADEVPASESALAERLRKVAEATRLRGK